MMYADILQTLSPVLCFALSVVVQLVSCRFFALVAALKSLLLGFVSGFAALIAFELYIRSNRAVSMSDFAAITAASALTYTALGYCYIGFVALSITSLRMRMLRELYKAEKGLSLEEILSRYNAKDMVDIRIKRLVDGGRIIYKDGRYFLGNARSLLIINKILVAMKLLLFGKKDNISKRLSV